MNSPFVITDLPNNDWAVSWPTFETTFTENMKFNLVSCIFTEVKCNEVGLGVSLDEHDEPSILWVKEDVWLTEISEEYAEYLYKNYRITGAVFHSLTDAESFKDVLEKRYVWQLLKE